MITFRLICAQRGPFPTVQNQWGANVIKPEWLITRCTRKTPHRPDYCTGLLHRTTAGGPRPEGSTPELQYYSLTPAGQPCATALVQHQHSNTCITPADPLDSPHIYISHLYSYLNLPRDPAALPDLCLDPHWRRSAFGQSAQSRGLPEAI